MTMKKDELSKTSEGAQPRITRRELTRGALGAARLALVAGVMPRRARADDHSTPDTMPEAPPNAMPDEGRDQKRDQKHGEEAETARLVSDYPENELLLSQVKYVAVSELENKQCGNCALLIGRDGDYGRCGLFQKGQVHVTGWCTSYIYKPGS